MFSHYSDRVKVAAHSALKFSLVPIFFTTATEFTGALVGKAKNTDHPLPKFFLGYFCFVSPKREFRDFGNRRRCLLYALSYHVLLGKSVAMIIRSLYGL